MCPRIVCVRIVEALRVAAFIAILALLHHGILAKYISGRNIEYKITAERRGADEDKFYLPWGFST